jgi:hypothetical protein
MAQDGSRKRGRPQKFGRAAQLISLTVPSDVITWLEGIDDDMAWALVKVYERSTRNRTKNVEIAELVRFPGDAALIVVKPDLFASLPGVSLIHIAEGRALLALEHGKGVADLELFVLDRLEDRKLTVVEKHALEQLRTMLKGWRQQGIRFESRSIIVARRQKALA